jgi:hypothetical protein
VGILLLSLGNRQGGGGGGRGRGGGGRGGGGEVEVKKVAVEHVLEIRLA